LAETVKKIADALMQNIGDLVQSRLIALAPTHEQSHYARYGGAGDLSIQLLMARDGRRSILTQHFVSSQSEEVGHGWRQTAMRQHLSSSLTPPQGDEYADLALFGTTRGGQAAVTKRRKEDAARDALREVVVY